MEKWPRSCFAGRIIIREDRLGGLDWTTPCPVPTEYRLPTVPSLFFCPQHFDAAAAAIIDAFDQAGLIDREADLDDLERVAQEQWGLEVSEER